MRVSCDKVSSNEADIRESELDEGPQESANGSRTIHESSIIEAEIA